MKINNILYDIVGKHNFEIYEEDGADFSFSSKKIYIIKDNNKKYFYLAIYLDKLDLNNFLKSIQPEIFVYMDKYCKNENLNFYNGFEKNTTLIIFSNSENFEDIHEYIEEDFFYFKKQIIYLNNTEIKYIDKINGSFSDFIDEVIVDKTEFDKFVKDSDCIAYSIAAKFYEKIPFLTLKNNDIKSISIEDIFKRKITGENQLLLDLVLDLDLDDSSKIEEFING